MKLRLLALFAFLPLASCSTFNEGTIVGKRSRPVEPGFSRLGPTFTLEIEGKGADGKAVRKTVLVSEAEWSRVRVGERYSLSAPHTPRETSERAEKKPAEPRKIAVAKPSPAKPKKQTADQAKPDKHQKIGSMGVPASTPSPAPTLAKPSPRPAPLSYEEAEAHAAEDSRVRELKQKIHAATTEEEQKKAADDYYKRLFEKMRELAPEAKARIDKEEAAKLRPAASPAP